MFGDALQGVSYAGQWIGGRRFRHDLYPRYGGTGIAPQNPPEKTLTLMSTCTSCKFDYIARPYTA